MDSQGYVVHEGCDHIFFVGFLGAGKSTLARNLGKLFHRAYIDTDRLVERLECKSVTEIFQQDGEQAFRLGEERALRELSQRKSLLVSCGGGIVERAQCCELMHEMGTVVFLDGSLEDSLRQIQHPEKRPDLGGNARELYDHRRPLFKSAADYVIDIRDKTFENTFVTWPNLGTGIDEVASWMGIPWYAWLAVALWVLLILILLVMLASKRRKKRRSEAEAAQAGEIDAPPLQETEKSSEQTGHMQ